MDNKKYREQIVKLIDSINDKTPYQVHWHGCKHSISFQIHTEEWQDDKPYESAYASGEVSYQWDSESVFKLAIDKLREYYKRGLAEMAVTA